MADSEDRPLTPLDARVVLDTAHEAFVAMDEAGDVTEWNRAAERTFGWTREEAVGRELAELIIPPELREQHRVGLALFLSEGHGPVLDRRIELPAQHRDGHEVPVEITISAPRVDDRFFFHAFAHDIGARIRRETHRTLQLHASQALAREPDPDVAIPAVLREVCTRLGWRYAGSWLVSHSRGELVQYRAWHEDDLALAAFEVATRATTFIRGRGLPGRAWQEARSEWLVDIAADPGFIRRHYAARARLEHACAVPLVADGQVVGVLEFYADEHRAEDPELLRTLESIAGLTAQYLQRKQAEAEATAAKDAFVASVSHELRTPLTAIGGFARTIRDRHGTLRPDQVVEFAEIIVEQGRRLERIVDELLTMSRLDAHGITPHVEPLDLEALVSTTLHQLGETSVQVGRVGEGQIHALADPDLVRQVLVNLVTNAHRYGKPPIEVELSGSTEYACMRVRDHGPGVDQEFVPRLFDKFSRHDPQRTVPSGTGLGLSIARSLAQLQGGDVRYEPQEAGACFAVLLPALQDGEATAATA